MSNLSELVARKLCGNAGRRNFLRSLADHADANSGQIALTVPQMAALCEVTVRTIQTHLKACLDERLILRAGTFAVKGRVSNGYELSRTAIEALPDSPFAPVQNFHPAEIAPAIIAPVQIVLATPSGEKIAPTKSCASGPQKLHRCSAENPPYDNITLPPVVIPETSVLIEPLAGPTKPSGPAEARRFLDELRPALSTQGRERSKPKPCERVLPPLIAKHGYAPLMAAARAFYGHPERTKDGGQWQPGLQVIANDGRLERALSQETDLFAEPSYDNRTDNTALVAGAQQTYRANAANSRSRPPGKVAVALRLAAEAREAERVAGWGT